MLKAILGLALIAGVGANSGLDKGELVTPFHPTHVTGAHKGTDACPPCTYGMLPQIQVWVNKDNGKNVEKIVKTLDEAMVANKDKKLKAFVIFVDKDGAKHEAEIASIAENQKAKDVMLAHISPDNEAVSAYKVNTSADVKNTVMLYRNRAVTAKHVNFVADEKGLATLKADISELLK
jgi:hypothetical protein